jgi:hypothetical protein
MAVALTVEECVSWPPVVSNVVLLVKVSIGQIFVARALHHTARGTLRLA